MHGIPSDTTGVSLELRDYKNIYPNEEGPWFCICDTECTYVVDVQIPLGGHTMTVHQGVAFTTADCPPDETEVVNVRRLDPERTREFRSYARYKKDEERWFRDQPADGGAILTDWGTRTKLDDYR